MRIKPFQAVYPNTNYIASPDTFFQTVKEEYPQHIKNGFFNKTAQEALYVYRITSVDRSYIGLIACADIQDYFEGKIKKHENTLAAKEQQQMQLMIARGAMVKPVLLTYHPVAKIDKLLKEETEKAKPFLVVHFDSNEQLHEFWEVSDGTVIQKIQTLFLKKVESTYIADGHHRCSTTALMHTRMKDQPDTPDYDLLLSVFFPTQELEIHDYNRIILGLKEMSQTEFMAKLSKVFEIDFMDEPKKPSCKHEFVMLFNKEYYKLTWKEEVIKNYKKRKVVLDANMLDEKVLHDILGIEDVRTDTRIKYIEGPKGLAGIRDATFKNENRIGFMLYPVQLQDLLMVADMENVMPPKSTWFEPRIKNGLIVQEF